MLHLPENIPAAETLRQTGFCVKEFSLADAPHYGANTSARRILFLNIMPQKAVTELDFARTLAAAALNEGGGEVDVVLLPVKIAGQTYKTTPMAHMEAFYRDFEDFEEGCFDGLILTGAPVEHLDFEEVRYWPQLCRIMDWAETHVRSTLYICWGGQAGLYYHYGIPKYGLSAKRFGVFSQTVLDVGMPLMQGLAPCFPMPNSRHTEVRREDFAGKPVRIIAGSEESGVGVAVAEDGRKVFIVGHLEYEPNTLRNEYLRDVAKGLPIAPPQHYFENDDTEAPVLYTWEEAAYHFYRNWLMS